MLRLTLVCLAAALVLMTRLTHAQTNAPLDSNAPVPPILPFQPPQQPPVPNFLQMMMLRKVFDNWAVPMMMMYGGNNMGGGMFPLWAMWNMF